MSNKFKGNTALLITAIVWGMGFIFQKMGNAVMPPMSFNAIRQFLAAVVLSPVLIFGLRKSGYLSKQNNTYSTLAYRRKKSLMGGLVCGLCLLGGSVSQQIGLVTVSAGKSGFITTLYIVMTPILSVIVGNKVKRKDFVCILIAVVGFYFLSCKGGLGGVTFGDWLTLFGALCFAAQIVAVNHFVDKDNDIIISVLQMAFCGIIGLIAALIIEHPTMAQIYAGLPALLLSTFIPTALGFTLQIVGQKYTDSTSAALLMSLESVFSVIFGALLLGELMAGRELLGCAIIFAAVIINQVDIKRK